MKDLFANLPLVLDGATGTQLQKYGMPIGVCTEQWILENPQVIIEIQRAYAEAGSGAVYAPTFGANRAALKKYGLENEVRDYCLRLVELSIKATDGKVLVGGDIAPTGLLLEPFGTATIEELRDIYAQQASALDEAGVDFFAIETQMYLDEAMAAVSAVKSVSNKPVIVSFASDSGKTLWGEDLADALEELEKLGISAFGVNCCGSLEKLTEIMAELKGKTKLPLIAKPNAGLPEMVGGKAEYRMTPQELASYIPNLVANGAYLIGGCCGTHEGHIRAIADALQNM